MVEQCWWRVLIEAFVEALGELAQDAKETNHEPQNYGDKELIVVLRCRLLETFQQNRPLQI